MTAKSNNLSKLPQSWVSTELGESSDIIRGISFPKNAKTKTSQKGYIACLRTTNVQREVEWGNLWFVPQEFVKRDEQLVKKYDILISTANSLELVGKVCQVRALSYKATLGAFISLIRISPLLDQRFFYFQLDFAKVQSQIRALASTTTNISNVSTRKLAELQLVVPPFSEQKRIVAKIEELFTKLDAGIEALKKIKAQLKRYRQAVLKHAFEGKLTAEWRGKNKDKLEPASKLLEHIAKEREKQDKGKAKKLPPLDTSNLPELPDGWEWARLGQICEEVVKVNPKEKPEKEFVYLDIAAIDNTVNKITRPKKYLGKEAPSRARQLVKAGDILFSTVRTYLKNIAMVDKKFDGQIASTGFCVIQPHSIIRKKLIFFLSLCDFFINPLSKIQRGTSYPAVRDSDVFEQIVPITPVQEQQKIVEEIERHFSIADQIEKAIEQGLKQSDRLRQSILKKAFEGKLVPQDPSDEPAEKLLERIKAEKAKLQAEQKAKRKKTRKTKKKAKATTARTLFD